MAKDQKGVSEIEAILKDIGAIPDEVDGISLTQAKRTAIANGENFINALRVVRKLSA
jgi:hypothetical protein